MPRTLRIRLTPEKLQIELDGAGVVFEDEAAAAFTYDAPAECPILLDLGREALARPDRVPEAATLARTTRVTPEREARWLVRDMASPPAIEDPWAHHGEITVARPATTGPGPDIVAVLLLARARSALHEKATLASSSFWQRFWVRHFAPVDISLPHRPSEPERHDDLVRGIWQIFGRRALLDGERTKLSALAPLRLQDWLVAASLVGLPIWLVVHQVLRGRSVAHPTIIATVALVASTIPIYLRDARSRDPRAPAGRPTLRLPRLGDLRLPRQPAGCSGPERVRLGVVAGRHDQYAILLILIVGGIAMAPMVGYRVLVPAPDVPWYVVIATVVVMFAGLGLCIPLDPWLASSRLSLGERGLTLWPRGFYGRPRRILYTSIRRVSVAVTAHEARVLEIQLERGEKLMIGFPANKDASVNETSGRILSDIEATLSARMVAPGSYRLPGAGVSGRRH